MSVKKKGGQASSKLSASDAEAQSVLRMTEWLAQVDQAERMSTGTWFNIPPEYQGWVFMRCGIKTVDRAEALAGQLRRMGYIDAPAGTRCAGFESDGDRGLYVMIPRAGYQLIKERKRAIGRTVQKATSAFEQAVGSINKLGNGLNAQVRTQQSKITADLG